MAPLVDDDHLYSAAVHVRFIKTTLGFYGKTTANVLFSVKDICSVNVSFSWLIYRRHGAADQELHVYIPVHYV